MGLERSGRLITGAAAIMVGVFIAFALADVVIIKSVGIGLTIAVLLEKSSSAVATTPAVVPSVPTAATDPSTSSAYPGSRRDHGPMMNKTARPCQMALSQ